MGTFVHWQAVRGREPGMHDPTLNALLVLVLVLVWIVLRPSESE